MVKHATMIVDSVTHEIMLGGGKPIKMWTKGVPVEDEAKQQLVNLSKMPFVFHHVAAMPDVHFGIGATVGSVYASKGALIPAAVGVDIGCGMMAMRTSLKAEDLTGKLPQLRAAIEKRIPHGRTENGRKGDRGAWGNIPGRIQLRWDEALAAGYEKICMAAPRLKNANSIHHLGTLGTGNHFIEICLDTEQRVWAMLHSGSRGIGNQVGQVYIEKAKELMKKFFIDLPDHDLAYLPEKTEEFNNYVYAVNWAQAFALSNRECMMFAVEDALAMEVNAFQVEEIIDCHHNYVAKEHHFGENVFLTRKGAVRARVGDAGIIPGSMGARSYIVSGLGNVESFNSCSHGAGRAMSRTKAKKLYTVADHIAATEGVECRKDADVIDETPMAYKNIDAVMEAQKDLVEIVHTLKQVICVKG